MTATRDRLGNHACRVGRDSLPSKPNLLLLGASGRHLFGRATAVVVRHGLLVAGLAAFGLDVVVGTVVAEVGFVGGLG